MLKLKVTKQSEAIKELMSRFALPAVSSQGYEVIPKRKPLGGSTAMCQAKQVRELLERLFS